MSHKRCAHSHACECLESSLLFLLPGSWWIFGALHLQFSMVPFVQKGFRENAPLNTLAVPVCVIQYISTHSWRVYADTHRDTSPNIYQVLNVTLFVETKGGMYQQFWGGGYSCLEALITISWRKSTIVTTNWINCFSPLMPKAKCGLCSILCLCY